MCKKQIKPDTAKYGNGFIGWGMYDKDEVGHYCEPCYNDYWDCDFIFKYIRSGGTGNPDKVLECIKNGAYIKVKSDE